MTRFLLVVPPLVGHTNPLAAVAGELLARGHEVAWAGYGEQIRALAGPRAEVFECAMPDSGLSRPPGLAGPAAFQHLWEKFFVPLGDLMAPGVDAAIDAFRPDAVFTDQHAVAGALVAERRGIVHVTSATTSAELVDPLAELPKVGAWLDDLLGGLRARVGDPSASGDPRFSPHGVIAFTGRELVGDKPLPSEHVHLVGPAVAPRAGVRTFRGSVSTRPGASFSSRSARPTRTPVAAFSPRRSPRSTRSATACRGSWSIPAAPSEPYRPV